jgi:hypothetical protein
MISGRYGVTATPERAIREIMRWSKAAFNSEVAMMLAQVISIFPTGSMVKVAECSTQLLVGAQGAVMKSNAEKPHQPILVLLRSASGNRITPKTIDLSAESFARLELVM